MIKESYAVEFWSNAQSCSCIKVEEEFNINEERDFIERCLFLKQEKRLIRTQRKISYQEENIFDLFNESLIIEKDRERLIMENGA